MKIGEPIVIVGDLHGQFHDLVHMLEKAGDPMDINYLFLGDYVDRGIFGMEVVLTLIAIKVCSITKDTIKISYHTYSHFVLLYWI